MKIQITENDIKRMVYNGVKRVIFESLDIRDVVGDLPVGKVASALEAVYPEAVSEFKSNNGNFRAMLDTVSNAYDSSPEEKKAEFRAQLGVQEPVGTEEPAGIPDMPDMITSWESEGGNDEDDNLQSSDEPIDFELDPIISERIKRKVDEVVTRRLNEVIDTTPGRGMTQDELSRLQMEHANREKKAQEICTNLGYTNFWRYGYAGVLCVELQRTEELSKIPSERVWSRAERLQRVLRSYLGEKCRVDVEVRGYAENGMCISSYAKLYIY